MVTSATAQTRSRPGREARVVALKSATSAAIPEAADTIETSSVPTATPTGYRRRHHSAAIAATPSAASSIQRASS